jgi:hypothetical protein
VTPFVLLVGAYAAIATGFVFVGSAAALTPGRPAAAVD